MEVGLLRKTGACSVLGPLMFPEGIIVGISLVILSIRPVLGHGIPADGDGNIGVKGLRGTRLRIATSRILRPQSMNSEGRVPKGLRRGATQVGRLAIAKLRLPRASAL